MDDRPVSKMKNRSHNIPLYLHYQMARINMFGSDREHRAETIGTERRIDIFIQLRELNFH